MTQDSQRSELLLIILALSFSWLNATTLWFQAHTWPPVMAAVAITCTSLLAHYFLNRYTIQRDPLLFPVALILTSWGLIIISRVAPNFLERQIVWFIVGVLALCGVATSKDRLRWLRRFKYTWLLVSLLLLGATLLLGVNPAGEGARRWLSVAGLFLQPSEVLRLLLVAFLAAFFSERTGFGQALHAAGTQTSAAKQQMRVTQSSNRLAKLFPLAPSFVMWFAALGLQATQQDIGAAALLLITYVFMLYMATGEPAFPLLGILMLVVAITIGYHYSSLIALRVDIWLRPWLDPQGNSFQIVQSLIAVASGGVFGQGLGQGRPIYVPAVHTDFPFAAVTEEFGFIGAIGLLFLFCLLLFRVWRIMRGAQSAYVHLLAGGLGVLIVTQVFVIIGGNLGLIPLTGVTVPFISYGGSSMLVSFTCIGLLIRMSCDYLADQTAIKREPDNLHLPNSPGSDLVLKVTASQRMASRNTVIILSMLLITVAGSAGYWGVVRSAQLTDRDDNPRRIDTERAIDRGSILARDGSVLAASQLLQSKADYSPLVYERVYPIPVAAPVVGYYSLWHGVGGMEAYADSILRGSLDPLERLIHQPQVGGVFTTTIDLPYQQKIGALISGTVGAAVVLNWHSGEVLALASAPVFDPATLDVNWETLRNQPDAPLLNRVTQGLYQPGGLLTWLYANENGLRSQNTYEAQPWDPTDRLNLGKSVPFELDNASVPYPTTSYYTETVGQGSLRLTPLRVAVTAARLAAGKTVTPTIASNGSPYRQTIVGSAMLAEYTGLAQSGAGQYAGWYVGINSDTVIVIILESQTPSLERLKQLIGQLH